METLEKKCQLTVTTPERRHWRRSDVYIVNFKYILHPFSNVSIFDFEQANVNWEGTIMKIRHCSLFDVSQPSLKLTENLPAQYLQC